MLFSWFFLNSIPLLIKYYKNSNAVKLVCELCWKTRSNNNSSSSSSKSKCIENKRTFLLIVLKTILKYIFYYKDCGKENFMLEWTRSKSSNIDLSSDIFAVVVCFLLYIKYYNKTPDKLLIAKFIKVHQALSWMSLQLLNSFIIKLFLLFFVFNIIV